MANYTADASQLAKIRAAAAAYLKRDLDKGTVTTKSGTFHIGKGTAQGNVSGFNLESYRAAVESGQSGTALMRKATGNVFRENSPDLQQHIVALTRNRDNPAAAVDITPRFKMDNTSVVVSKEPNSVPPRSTQVQPMARQMTDNAVPYTIGEPTIAHAELASAVSVPSENLSQIGQSLPQDYLSSTPDNSENEPIDYYLGEPEVSSDDTTYYNADEAYDDSEI